MIRMPDGSEFWGQTAQEAFQRVLDSMGVTPGASLEIDLEMAIRLRNTASSEMHRRYNDRQAVSDSYENRYPPVAPLPVPETQVVRRSLSEHPNITFHREDVVQPQPDSALSTARATTSPGIPMVEATGAVGLDMAMGSGTLAEKGIPVKKGVAVALDTALTTDPTKVAGTVVSNGMAAGGMGVARSTPAVMRMATVQLLSPVQLLAVSIRPVKVAGLVKVVVGEAFLKLPLQVGSRGPSPNRRLLGMLSTD